VIHVALFPVCVLLLQVINCKIGASKGKSDLFAMVVMETSSDITQCISKLHGSEFQGQKLQLKKVGVCLGHLAQFVLAAVFVDVIS